MMAADNATAGSLLSPPQETAQSRLASFPFLFTRWAYNIYNDRKIDLSVDYYGLHEALEDVGASLDVDEWKFWRITHGDIRPRSVSLRHQTYFVNEQQYLATGAHFVFPIEPKAGVLVIAKQFSARRQAVKLLPEVTELPELQATSDLAFGAWSLTPGTTSLRHIFTWAVINEPTVRAIRRAMQILSKKTHDLDFWPGIEVPITSEAAQGLLGSPCGQSVGYLLATHKEQLGHLEVKSIRIFEQESRIFIDSVPLSLYWDIGPVTPVAKEGEG